MSSSEEEYLDWAPKRRIPLPPEAADEYMLVRIHDFQRLRKRIDEALSPRHENIPAAYFALFGAALATGVAVPPLLTASGLPTWIIPTFIVSASAFLALGLILVFVARILRKGQRRTTSEIAQEMRDIEETYRGNKFAAPVARGRSRKTRGSR
jgi:hypothetical protein